MRTASSLKVVGELALPKNLFPVVGAGKMPALSKAVEFGSTMQDGIVFPGNGAPCTIPAGRTPPGQFFARTPAATWVAEGTVIVFVPKFPPNVEGQGPGF